MIEPELKNELEKIDQHLLEIKQKAGPASPWRSFFNGVMSALGYVAGIAIVVVILGWILQKTGLLPAFREQLRTFNKLVNQAKRFTEPGNNEQPQPQSNQGGGATTVTLPDGRQVRVNIEQ